MRLESIGKICDILNLLLAQADNDVAFAEPGLGRWTAAGNACQSNSGGDRAVIGNGAEVDAQSARTANVFRRSRRQTHKTDGFFSIGNLEGGDENEIADVRHPFEIQLVPRIGGAMIVSMGPSEEMKHGNFLTIE